MLSFPTQHDHIYFPNLVQLKILQPLMWLKPKKGVIATDTLLINIPPWIFRCLQKQADMFLHNCANAILSLKRPKDLHLSILVTFLCKKISITLQNMQTSSILNQVVVIHLPTSRLPSLHHAPSLTTTNLLHAIDFNIEKYSRPTTVINFWHGDILTSSLN